ncbi:hypothetical protein Tsubulata_001340 [Turnera subulata]|uniref:Pentatricopeptide repeat-containing protein n=1 Tax=Turnera subulata TaxID=218843 RepID=A0A9Q0FG14_9ROSI|nr:hypothetical protein Tsubulata_001340 [Turnera subulata]
MLNLKKYQPNLASRHGKLSSIRFLSDAAKLAVDMVLLSQSQSSQPTTTGETSMPNPHLSPSLDPSYFISTLFKCRNMGQTKQLHAHVYTNGMLPHNLTLANKLLYKYAQLKDLVSSYALFGRMAVKDAVSWSVFIGGLAKVGDYTRCFETFRELVRHGDGVQPDNYTLPSVIRACRDTMGLVMALISRLYLQGSSSSVELGTDMTSLPDVSFFFL